MNATGILSFFENKKGTKINWLDWLWKKFSSTFRHIFWFKLKMSYFLLTVTFQFGKHATFQHEVWNTNWKCHIFVNRNISTLITRNLLTCTLKYVHKFISYFSKEQNSFSAGVSLVLIILRFRKKFRIWTIEATK